MEVNAICLYPAHQLVGMVLQAKFQLSRSNGVDLCKDKRFAMLLAFVSFRNKSTFFICPTFKMILSVSSL